MAGSGKLVLSIGERFEVGLINRWDWWEVHS